MFCSTLRFVRDFKFLFPAKETSESKSSPGWLIFWLLVKLLTCCCCVEEWESSSGSEKAASLCSLWVASVSDEGRLICSEMETAGPRLSRLNGKEMLESTDRMLDLEYSPLWGLLPSEGWALLVGVPIDPLIVRRSVGENSGSLIGPLGANGVKIVDGD